MIAVIIERCSRALAECYGVKNVGEIPFFDTILSEVLDKNSVLKGAEKTIKIPAQNQKNELEKLKVLLSKKFCERVLVTYSDVYFFGENADEFIRENEGDFVVKNNANHVAFCVVEGSFLLQKLNENNDDFSSFFKTIKCEKTYREKFIVIENPLIYKGFCRDVLCGSVPYRLPEVAQGIYASSVIPGGDFVIVPPVYFGDDIQIEKGCVIGPNVIISDGVLVAGGSRICNSVIGENSYVSSRCRVEGCVASSNVVLRRNSTILNDSILCHDVTVGEGSVVESNSFIRAFSRVDDYGDFFVSFKAENSDTVDGFYGYTPERAARLGAATGICFDMPKIGIASDGELNSTALKLAFLGGALTTGAQCYDFGNGFYSSLHYFMDFCQLDCAAFFSGNENGTLISLFRKGETGLSRSDFFNLKSVISSSDIPRSGREQCKSIRQIHGMQRMYVQNITRLFEESLDFYPVFNSDNAFLCTLSKIITSKIGFKKSGKRVEFNVNYGATKVTVNYDGIVYSHSKLLEIASFYRLKYMDIFKDFFKFDSLILSFYIMKIISLEKENLKEITEKLPRFYVAEKNVNNPCGLCVLAADLSRENKIDFRKDTIFYKDGLSAVKINQLNKGEFCIRAKSPTMEAAAEIVENLTRFIAQRDMLNY